MKFKISLQLCLSLKYIITTKDIQFVLFCFAFVVLNDYSKEFFPLYGFDTNSISSSYVSIYFEFLGIILLICFCLEFGKRFTHFQYENHITRSHFQPSS